MRIGRSRLAIAGVMCLAAGCAQPPTPASARGALQAVALPDLSRMSASVQAQLRDRYASLTMKAQDPGTPALELGEAYGDTGTLLMAAAYLDPAERAFLNAQSLMPDDARWPYYLAHLYLKRNDLSRSVTFFEQTLQLRPDDVPALIWLGGVYVDQGQPEKAELLLGKALMRQPHSAAALFRLGSAALARKDDAAAVRYLEAALSEDPRASIAHYPLALAYRGLGDVARANAHLRQRGDVEPALEDPLMRKLGGSLESVTSLEAEGVKALDEGEWSTAADYFRKATVLAPDDPSMRHRLGTALAMMGDLRGAREQFEETVRRSPGFAKAHYSLGLMLSTAGQPARALDEFTAAVRADPDDVKARFEVAIALARVGRWADSRDRLSEGVAAYPGQPLFAHALARLLAASPDDRVRDGRRAVELALELQKQSRSAEVFETLAMGLAAAGQYDQAVVLQRQVITSAQRAGRADLLSRLTANLTSYEHRQPSHTPWAANESVAATLMVN